MIRFFVQFEKSKRPNICVVCSVSMYKKEKTYILIIDFSLFTLFMNCLRAVLSDCNPDAKRLYDEILSNYNKLVRPVKNVTDSVTVKFKLKLSQLIDVVIF